MGTWAPITYQQYKEVTAGGGSGGSGRDKTIYLKVGEQDVRFLILDDNLFELGSHEYWWKPPGSNYSEKALHACLKLITPPKRCLICERDIARSFAGHLTVIRLTPNFSKQGKEYCFERGVLRAKAGGEKPGMLHTLRKMHEKRGGLRGVVVECSRNGKMSETCGNNIVFDDKVADIPGWLNPQIQEYLDRINQRLERPITLEKYLERHPVEPIDFMEYFAPLEDDEIISRLDSADNGKREYDDSPQSKNSSKSQTESADYAGSDFTDDDIPF